MNGDICITATSGQTAVMHRNKNVRRKAACEDFNYASAQRSVAGDVMVLSCSSVRPSVRAFQNIVNTDILQSF